MPSQRADAKCGVGGREIEKARRRAERDKLSKAGDRQQTAFAEQRHELVGGDGEPDQVHRRECTARTGSASTSNPFDDLRFVICDLY